MAVSTGPIKFTTTAGFNSSGVLWENTNNLLSGSSGDASVGVGGSNRRFQLRTPDSDILDTIPSDATIVGIEIITKTRVDGGSENLDIRPQIVSGSNRNGDVTLYPISNTTNQTIVTGGPDNLLGLDEFITDPSLLSGFRIRYRREGTASNTLFLTGDTEAPTVTFHYTLPTPLPPPERSFVLPPVRSSGMYVRES